LSWSLIGSSRNIARAFVTPRYASHSSTVRHHRVAIVSDARGWRWHITARSSETAVTCADEVFGMRRLYRVTPYGNRVMSAALAVHDRDFPAAYAAAA
jgi:hypothetical protein